ncbi:MAG: hypothetical protein H6811_03115 [Phycisphaeraceae bacterium]|nr:hypothetical protein [Phycisphaeraceae bacterium]
MTVFAPMIVALVAGHASALPEESVDVRTSTFMMSSQFETAVAFAPDGAMLSVWTSRRQNGGRSGVFGQWLTEQGVAVGEEFALAAIRDTNQRAPAVASGGAGQAWAAWQAFGQDGDAGAIIARRFSKDGARSAEVLVNENWVGDQVEPVLAVDPGSGRVLVAWEDHLDGSRGRVAWRVLNADGSIASAEQGTEIGSSSPSVAAGTNGQFLLAWATFDSDSGRPAGVRVATIGPNGLASESQSVSLTALDSQIEPVVAACEGGYIVSWVDAESDGDGYGIVARRLRADGGWATGPVVVNSRAEGVQNAPAPAARPDGSIAIAFNTDLEDGRAVMVRRFSPDLVPLGDEQRASQGAALGHAMRDASGTARAAFSPTGELAIAWSGDAGLGDSSSANLTLIGATAADGPLGVRPDMCAASFSSESGSDALFAAGPHVPPTHDPRRVAVDAPREIRIGPADIGFSGISNTGWEPPDPHMAAGPTHVVVMTNGGIAFYTKTGTLTFQDEIEDSFGFWGSLGTTGFVFDPEVIYDPASGRFFAMAAEAFAPGNRSYVLIAVSDDSDPNGTWHKYRFETTSLAGDLFDSPNIGVTADAVVVTGDGFGLSSNYPVFTWDKASLLAGNPPAVSRQATLSTSTQSAGIPAFQAPDPGLMYMLEHQEGSNRTQLRVIAMRDLLTGPTFATAQVSVPSYSAPGNMQQMGTTVRPNSFDARFWSIAYRNGSIWGTHHVNSNPVRVRWYEIATNGWPTSGQSPSLVQSGEIAPGAGIHTTFSAIDVADDGTAGVVYARSASNEFISMNTAYRIACDPLGTMRPGVRQQTNNSGHTSGRWGDYASIDVDPADGRTLWSYHEYNQNNSWRTWVASLEPDSCCAADLDGDGDADGDDFFIYLDLFAAGDPDADLDGDGDRDADDFFAYLDLFALGCP